MKEHTSSVIIVIIAGLIWSFGAVVVKNMTDPQSYQLPYLIIRGLTVAMIVGSYLFFKDRKYFFINLLNIDKITIFGGILLTITFIGFIYSITNTTAAVTLLMLALMPFFASLIAYLFINERISKKNLVAMIIAFFGIVIMVLQSQLSGSTFGLITGFISSLGFAGFTVALRSKNNNEKFYILIIGGLLCSLICSIILIIMNFSIEIPINNILLSITHGLLVACGLILYSIGSKKLLSGELSLLSLLEVVGGIFWAWLPFMNVNEIPDFYTMLGGLIICISIIINSTNIEIIFFQKKN
ncbi:MAG: DMT family transporter [Alphaproteobacteria bacterium]|jgi:drug/metabolite transporter (DMT)-like permease|nr:DMT family transporter [Alphaproteobacteria bacterium]